MEFYISLTDRIVSAVYGFTPRLCAKCEARDEKPQGCSGDILSGLVCLVNILEAGERI
jgi:hypothetical protein